MANPTGDSMKQAIDPVLLDSLFGINAYLYYTCLWVAATVVAVVLLLRNCEKSGFANYFRFLTLPWKLVTFVVAMGGITVAAPYSGDPTWDYYDSIIISCLVYALAPWSVGVIFLAAKRKTSLTSLYIALIMMLFSSSWFYDGYILLRDGVYPSTWFSNLIISPTFFIAGGLFWNLEHIQGVGIKFSFQEGQWYNRPVSSNFRGLIWVAIPFMMFAFYGVCWFVSSFSFFS